MDIGAHVNDTGGCDFRIWAPFAKDLKIQLSGDRQEEVPMTQETDGYWSAKINGLGKEVFYTYSSSEFGPTQDPVSFYQPQGVHGPSQVVDHGRFSWSDQNWRNIDLSQMIIYELHVGTFTKEGTFSAVIARLDELKEIGVNAIELMPVAQFPGDRNWGYDGVDLFAVQNSYGGVEGLKKLINEAHKKGLAVILDVVYNHLGPEGNHLRQFGPYFTKKYNTPWGEAINFDDAYCDHVRHFFIQNALYWFEYFHVDALRLDAIHAIYDKSEKHILQELKEKVQGWSKKKNRNVHIIAESDLNDSTVIREPKEDGYGLDAQWCDDFHHAVHALMTGEDTGYYQDFGNISHIVKALERSFVYAGEYSHYRRRPHGNDASDIAPNKFVVFIQNHDQIGNRLKAERLSRLVSFEELKLLAGIMLSCPYIPLLFMGEEYGEEAPFNYFVSHSEKELIEAVRKGRKAEFASFKWAGEPPDPQDEKTFNKSKIDWSKKQKEPHRSLRQFYKELIATRKKYIFLSELERKNITVSSLDKEKVLYFSFSQKNELLVLINFSDRDHYLDIQINSKGTWQKLIDSRNKNWKGPGERLPKSVDFDDPVTIGAHNFAIYTQELKNE